MIQSQICLNKPIKLYNSVYYLLVIYFYYVYNNIIIIIPTYYKIHLSIYCMYRIILTGHLVCQCTLQRVITLQSMSYVPCSTEKTTIDTGSPFPIFVLALTVTV